MTAREAGEEQLTSAYSVRDTLGTSMLWVEGEISSCNAEEISGCPGAASRKTTYKLLASEDLL